MEQFINQAPILVVILLLAAGFVLLIKGADFFVEGSSSVAKRFNVPAVIIGLTVVAMGTSLPETAVSISASIADNNELAISNAVGSNIFNLMVVIGLCAVMTPVLVGKDTIVKDIPYSAFAALVLLGLGLCSIGDASGNIVGRIDGLLMLVLFVSYLIMLVKRTIRAQKEGKAVAVEGGAEDEIKLISIPKSLLFIVGGAAAIAFGGDLTVDSASRIAIDLGMSQTLVGLTIVSIGTSLPELVTSIVAARKNEIGMALGNAIGSNIFNILMVLGVASVISPMTILTENIIDIAILLACTLVVWLFAATKKQLNRWEGVVMLSIYAAYAVYIVVR